MSHPRLGKRYFLSIFLCVVLLFGLNPALLASVTIYSITAQSNQAYQGSTGNVVLRFYLNVSGENVDQITIKNESSDVPFGASGIKKITIHSTIPPGVGNQIGVVNPPDGAAQSQQIPVNIAAGTNDDFYVVYEVASDADASEIGGTEKYTQARLETVRGTTTGEINPTQSVVNNIKIIASGLSYDQSYVQSIVPETYVGAGFTDVPMMKFRLRANNQNITINSITLWSGNGTAQYPGNYAPNAGVKESYVKKISIYEDTNNNEYFDGLNSVDTLVGTRNLGDGNNQYEARVTINNTSGITNSTTRMFFTFYDMGTGIAEGTVVRADIADATGIGSLSGALQLNGVLPTSKDISLTITSVNARLVSATENIPTLPVNYYAIAGERQIPMIKFTLNTNASFSNAKVTLKNPGGTFLASGEGVSKLSLYRDIGGSLQLIGATSSFANNTTAEISNLYLPAGNNIDYYVYYDINVGATIGSNIQCQIENIEGSGIFFGGSLPGPDPAVSFITTPAILVVQKVSEDATSVGAGGQFNLQIGVRNVYQTGGNHVMYINTVRPSFFFQDIGGQDISSEYSYTLLSSTDAGGTQSPPNYRVTLNTTVTYNFIVQASNLKTKGPVIVDAFIDYKDAQFIGNKPQSIIMSRYLSGGSYTSAALGSNYGTFVATSGSDIPNFSMKLPDYIASMNVLPYGFYAEKPFLNGDIVAKNSKLKIYLANQGDVVDMASLMVRKDGVLLSKGSDYLLDETNGIITIQDMGSRAGIITIDGYSGDAALETATIKYSIETSFKVKDFMPGPSPYKPSQGSMYFSFQVSEVSTAKIYVYDSAGKLIWESDSINCSLGYNEVSWDGDLDIGGTIGRGVYIVTIIAKSEESDNEKRLTTKFAVF
ncbi:MAG: hypothetical protein KKA19_02670 [Candidatus Margulisbacteria bacterium]|nr:hypothetical protein [Candidatus Margulisiibacteriota bacterium]